MNKELQDKVWAVLPNEFKEEVKKMYKECNKEVDDVKTICYRKCFHHIELLVRFFGEHNLTSDTEESTNVASKPRFKGGDYVTVHFENGKRMVGHINEVLLNGAYDVDFGDGCMIHNVTEACIEPYTEPHNVEDEEVSKPTHLSDMEEDKSEPVTSTLPIRLQVATAAMQGILANENHRIMDVFINHKDVQEAFTLVAQASMKQADALLAECGYEKKGD